MTKKGWWWTYLAHKGLRPYF